MSSHPNRVPCIEIERVGTNEWEWECMNPACPDDGYAYGYAATHAEAIAAADAHCKEASK